MTDEELTVTGNEGIRLNGRTEMKTETIDRSIEILLVNDNEGDARLLEKSLEEGDSNGFSLTSVNHYRETLNRYDDKKYDLVILDLSVPGKTFNTFMDLRSHSPKTPVILLTNNNDEGIAIKALQNGAQDYLIKDQLNGSLLRRSIRCAIERNHARQREYSLAYFDALTGLPNRQLFNDRLNQALTHAQRYDHKVALLFIDLDGFKTINDTLGHEIGDLLLQAVSRRLEDCLRKSDTVARMGGDEFTCILPNIEYSGDIKTVATKINAALSEPFELKGHEINISGSIGASLYPDDAIDADDLINKADKAMYDVKRRGRDDFRFFAESFNISNEHIHSPLTLFPIKKGPVADRTVHRTF